MENFSNVRRKLAQHPHNIAFSELDKLPFYEYEDIVEKINEEIDKENQKRTEEATGLVSVFNLAPGKPANI